MKKISFFILSLMTISMFSCDEDNSTDETLDIIDTTAPELVTELTATPLNTAVKLNWVIPTDDDFALTRIQFGENIIDVDETVNELLVEGLENNTEYTFSVSTIDDSENSSDAIEISATPDKYVTTIEGQDISSGSFKTIDATFPVTIEIDGSEYTRSFTAGTNQFFWEGTWRIENDTTYQFDYEYYSIISGQTNHVADLIDTKNMALTYDYSDSTFYIENIFEKIDGPDGFLQGNYKRYIKTVSSDDTSYNDTTYYYVEILEDGTITYEDSEETTETSWGNEDLINDNFLFISYNDKTYLVDRNRNTLYYKE